MNATYHARSFLATAIAIAVVLGSSNVARADNADKVDAFLARLGLVDLQILHLEERLDGKIDATKKVELGRRLADLYASRLLTAQKDAEKYGELRERINALITEVPAANTSSLEVMLLQADFSRAERFTNQWITDPQNQTAQQNAKSILEDIAPKLDQHRLDLTAQADKLRDVVEDLPEGDVREAREKELFRLREVAGRATFFAGWANYYLGLLTSTPETPSTEPLAASRDAFRQFLDIAKDEKYEDTKADWLGLESVYRSRAVIGLGLVESALGGLDESRVIFKWLDSPAVPLDIRDQAPTCYLLGLLNSGRFADARAFGEEQMDAFSNEPTQGKVSFCAAAVRAGFAREDATPDVRQLGKLGIAKLAKMQCFRAIQQLMDQCTIDLGDESGFFLKWLKGQQLLKKANQTKDPADYQAAADQLNDALADPQARREASSAGQARSDLAECYYGLKELESAAREFQRASGGLKASNRDLAAQALWNAFICYLKLAASQPTAARSAIAVGEEFKQDFADHENAKKIDFYIARVQKKAESPEAAIKRLNQVPPDSPNYLDARFDLCGAWHELWQKAKGADRKKYAVEVRDAVEAYFEAAKDDTDQTRKLKALLLAAETALSPPEVDLLKSLLDRAEPIAVSLPTTVSAVAQYHYYRLQLARITGDDVARRKHAAWLLENAAGSVYELSALIARATAIDGEVKNTQDEQQRNDLNQEGYQVYGRLVKRLGSAPETLKQSKNARVACSRLAEYALRLGKHAEAAESLERLLKVFPNELDYLLGAARAHFDARHFEKCLDMCRELFAQGLESGTPEWYEAKYMQLFCLAELDIEQARKVWRQFEILHPDRGGPHWREKFQDIERMIKAGGR